MAKLVATAAIDMINPDIWYGAVSSYGPTHITLVDGNVMGTYYGTFSYDLLGNVYGTLTGFQTWVGGALTLSVTGGNINAFDYYSAIQAGNGTLAVNLVFAAADSITGSNFADALIGLGGNDSIDGSGGSDFILGGNNADRLTGAAGLDSLYGETGNDKIFGGIGADYLNGGPGADTLAGGSGKDTLNGGIDSTEDVFVFNLASDSAVGVGADRIERFAHNVDEIDISGIDANTTNGGNNAFSFNGTIARAHSVWFVAQSGGVLIRGDIDGNKLADFEVFVANTLTLTAGDFVL